MKKRSATLYITLLTISSALILTCVLFLSSCQPRADGEPVMLEGSGYRLAVSGTELTGIEYSRPGYSVQVDIPEGITRISGSFFDDFHGAACIVSLTIPSTVTQIDDSDRVALDGWRLTELRNLSPIIDESSPTYAELVKKARFVMTDEKTESRIRKTDDGYFFYVHGDEASLIGYNGTETELTLPSEPFGMEYTVAQSAFSGMDTLKSVIFGKGLTATGYKSFADCDQLEEVTLSDSLVTIASHTFYGSPIKTLSIPSSVTNIERKALSVMVGLTSITVHPDNPAYSDADGVLMNKDGTILHRYPICRPGSKYVMPKTVKTVAYDAFEHCEQLTDITLSESLEDIEAYAFAACTRLRTLIIPDSVRIIGEFAFADCPSLIKVHLGAGVQEIWEDAFYRDDTLIEVSNASSLPLKTGSEDHGSIAKYAKNLYTPAEGQSKLITSGDYVFYADASGSYLVKYTGTDAVITLPADCNGTPYEIFERAFYYSDSITSVTVPGGVQKIGRHAFFGCSSLTKVHFPLELSWIGYRAFASSPLTEAHFARYDNWNQYHHFAIIGNAGKETEVEEYDPISEEIIASPSSAASYLLEVYADIVYKAEG